MISPVPHLSAGETLVYHIPYSVSPEDQEVVDKLGLPLLSTQNCPSCGEEGMMVEIIAHLNNTKGNTWNSFDLKYGVHGWSFKQIGEWLKTLGY